MIPEELIQELEVLKERGYKTETIEEDKKIYIIFRDYPLPPTLYNMDKTDLLIFTTPYYPNAGFDMFWVNESLRLVNNNVPKNGDSVEPHLGKPWRRFSYHPYSQKPWNPSEDNVIIFMGYVEQRLRKGD